MCRKKRRRRRREDWTGTAERPVPMILSSTTTETDVLIWIPSVLGLSAGATTLKRDAWTCQQVLNAICICWLFIRVRSWMARCLIRWKVTAFGARRHGFVAFLLQDRAHHSCPMPLMVPPPLIASCLTPWKYSHLSGSSPSQISGSVGAMMVPTLSASLYKDQQNQLDGPNTHFLLELEEWLLMVMNRQTPKHL